MLRNELSEETRADKARDFIGTGCLGREQEGKGTQEDCSAMRLAVLGFMVIGFHTALGKMKQADVCVGIAQENVFILF